jgi:hypothetical protein
MRCVTDERQLDESTFTPCIAPTISRPSISDLNRLTRIRRIRHSLHTPTSDLDDVIAVIRMAATVTEREKTLVVDLPLGCVSVSYESDSAGFRQAVQDLQFVLVLTGTCAAGARRYGRLPSD